MGAILVLDIEPQEKRDYEINKKPEEKILERIILVAIVFYVGRLIPFDYGFYLV